MNKLKLVLALIILACLGVAVYQNLHFFQHPQYLRLNLGLEGYRYQTPEMPLAVFLMGFFLVGFLIAYFMSLGLRFQAKRVLRGQMEEIRALKEELSSLRIRRAPVFPKPECLEKQEHEPSALPMQKAEGPSPEPSESSVLETQPEKES